MSFPGNVYPTPDGLVLNAKAQQGKMIELTRMNMGDGVLSGGMPWLQKVMISPRLDLPIARRDLLANGVASIVGY